MQKSRSQSQVETLTKPPENPRLLASPLLSPTHTTAPPSVRREIPAAMSAAARVLRGCRALASSAAAAAAAGGKRPAASAAVAAAPKVTKADAAEAKATRGIMRPMPVSEALRRFAGGAPEISRANAVKIVWAHIKANDLQNPANKKEINCDEKLKSIFAGRDKVGMMEITKLLSPHFVKTN